MATVEESLRDPVILATSVSILFCIVACLVIALRHSVKFLPTLVPSLIITAALVAGLWGGKEIYGVYTDLLRTDDEVRRALWDIYQTNSTIRARHDELTSRHQSLQAQHESLRTRHDELQASNLDWQRQLDAHKEFLLAFRSELSEQDQRNIARLHGVEASVEREARIREAQLRFNREAIKALAAPGSFEEQGGVTLLRRAGTGGTQPRVGQ